MSAVPSNGTRKKKPVNSRRKGKEGEQEVVHALRAAGIPARRSVQYKGTQDSADVEDDPDLPGDHQFWLRYHLEVKRTKTFSLHVPSEVGPWVAQARSESGDRLPVVVHRGNAGKDWWALLCLDGDEVAMKLTAFLERHRTGRVPR